MTQKPQLHDKILEKAGQLFREKGYATTSMKQIAEASGCTNAALYYYFEGGKRHILHEVIHHMAVGDPFMASALSQADSLESLIISMSQALSKNLPHTTDRVNWLLLQFPTLPNEEKQFLQDRAFFGLQSMLQKQISRFVDDESTAEKIGWMLFCSFFGHQQIFNKMEIGKRIDFSLEEYGRFLAQMITEKE